MAIILWASGFQLCLYAQQAPKLSPKVTAAFNAPPMQLKEDDAPLLRLKKERFNAVLNEAKDRLDLYNRGLVRIPELIEVGKRLYRAEADLYDKPEEKAQVLQRQLDVYTDAEADLEKKVREGLVPHADLEQLRFDRLSLEIDLFKVRNVQDEHQSAPQPTPK